MRTAIAVCALVALTLATTYTLDDFHSYRDVEIDKDGVWEGVFSVTPTQIGWGAFQIEFSFDFGAGLPGRQVTMRVGRSLTEATNAPLVSKKFQAVASINTDTYAFNFTAFNCSASASCPIYFSLLAKCPDSVCLNSVTSNFWARLQDASGNYIYGSTRAHPFVLTTDVTTPDITLKTGNRNYFTYTPDTAATMGVHWYVSAFSSLAVGGSTTTWNDPQNTTAGGFIQFTKTEERVFTSGQLTYYVVALASTFTGDDATYSVCIGPNCSGAASVAVSLASLLSALFFLF
eukprot:m51a1_g2597 hypothetical protein (289) ;mRNA; r:450225-451275